MKKNFLLVPVPFFLFMVGYTLTYYFFQKASVVVPSILGKSVQEGLVILGKKGLFLAELKEQEDVQMKEGIIVRQIPQPGQSIRPQKPVYVTVTKKPGAKRMPSFYGLARHDIQSLAKKTAINVTIIDFPTMHTRGLCFAQSPAAHETIDGQIFVYVAKPTRTVCMVPDLRGMSYEDVKEGLSRAGVATSLFDVADEGELLLPEHKVIDQRPRAGSFVDIERQLHLTLQID